MKNFAESGHGTSYFTQNLAVKLRGKRSMERGHERK
jgi:hypothetical protein